jgi:hypothetical protein
MDFSQKEKEELIIMTEQFALLVLADWKAGTHFVRPA